MIANVATALLVAIAADVTVDAERLLLADVLPRVPAPWSALDLGAAPDPGQAVWLSAERIKRRVADAQLDPVPVRLPRRLRITRSLQRVDELRLRDMVEDALLSLVKPSAVRSITVRGGHVMPKGPVTVSIDAPTRWRDGRQTIMATLASPHGRSVTFPVGIELHEMQPRRVVDVQRGQSVRMRLQQAGLFLEAPGVAQEAGALESVIAVLPQGGNKVIHARIVGPRVVEVEP